MKTDRLFIAGLLLICACAHASALANYYATGDYVQDVYNGESLSGFYNENNGLRFDNYKSYAKGDFTSYAWINGTMARTEAGLLADGTYTNVHCLLCMNLSAEALENPSHDMSEEILTNGSMFGYYESGLFSNNSEELRFEIPRDAVSYKINTGYMPMKRIEDSVGNFLDYEYRGKIIFLGDEYYIRDISGDIIYFANGSILDGVSSEGFLSEYKGYRFKVANLSSPPGNCTDILLDVQRPNGTVVQVTVSRYANGVVDNIEISGIYGEESGSTLTASVIVYDLSTQVVLEDGEDLEYDGQVWVDWEVDLVTVDYCADTYSASDGSVNDCDISEYDDMDASMQASLLKSITIQYRHDLDGAEALAAGESLLFPNDFRLTYKGYVNDQFRNVLDSGAAGGNIQVRRGDSAHSVILDYTGTDGQYYNGVRLDEGPFALSDDFIYDGTVYYYSGYNVVQNIPGMSGDKVNITLTPTMGGSDLLVQDLQRYCDPEGGASASDPTYTHENCSDVGGITLRKLALLDALKDSYTLPITSSDYKDDQALSLDPSTLFIKKDGLSIQGSGISFDILFEENDNTIFFADDFSTDRSLGLNPEMVDVFSGFETAGYGLSMSLHAEGGASSDPDSLIYNATADLNADGDDDDTFAIFNVSDGLVILDLSDRGYDGSVDDGYSNDLFMDVDSDKTKDSGEAEIINDTDTLLYTPFGGDSVYLTWGTGNRIDAAIVYHPIEPVYSTYFLGTMEGLTPPTTYVTTTSTSTTSAISTTSTTLSSCTLPGDNPPCGVISLAEIIGHINLWADGIAPLGEVIDLINVWASGA